MFKLHFTNFGYCSNELPTLEDAKAEAKRCGFDCAILHKTGSNQYEWTTVGTWSIFSGFQELVSDYAPNTWAVERNS